MTAPQPKTGARGQRRCADALAFESFLVAIEAAGPLERIELERAGVAPRVVRGLADDLGIPADRVFRMLGQDHRANSPRRVSGSVGYAAMRLVLLVSIARKLLAASTHPDARDFSAGKWLGTWLQEPNPALGGRCPANVIDTPSGSELVERVLGAIESGAYH